jgi:hypothetical protein
MTMKNSKGLLGLLGAQVAETTTRISHLAAKSLVMQKFIDLTLPKLTPAQCGEVRVLLQRVLEDVMAVMDDATLPSAYHASFLEMTNEILRALDQQQAAGASGGIN